MKQVLRIFGFVLAVMLFQTISTSPFAASAYAQASTDDVFVVARVPVKARAESATQAKEIAQARGRREAIDILLRRLTPEQDWVYLPSLAANRVAPQTGANDGGSAGQWQPEAEAIPGASDPASLNSSGKRAVVIAPNRLVDLEQSFEVYDEKSSAELYRALITYRFNPDAVRRLLKDARIPYSEAQTRTALVLPVLETSRSAYLWERNNPWLAAWKSRPYTHELTPMIAPLGDLEDTTLLTARQALALSPEGLAAIAAKYRVSQVIIAHAKLQQVDGKDRVRVRLLNGYRESGKAEGVDELDLGNNGLGDGIVPAAVVHADTGYEFRPQPDEDFAATVGDVVADVTLSQPSGNFPMLAERLINSVIAKYASGWKAKTLIDHAAEAVLPATAFFDAIQDWGRIRSALIETPLVGGVQIGALSKRGAEMEIRLFGDPSRLQVTMENQGVVFWTETGERWFLATPSVASRYRGQRFLRERRRRGLFGDAGDGVNNGDFNPSGPNPSRQGRAGEFDPDIGATPVSDPETQIDPWEDEDAVIDLKHE